MKSKASQKELWESAGMPQMAELQIHAAWTLESLVSMLEVWDIMPA